MTRLFGVFVLFIIGPAELRPTNNDDLPIEEVFDNRLKNGYMHRRSLLKWRKFLSDVKSSGSIKRKNSPTLNPDDNVQPEPGEDKEIFHRKRIKRAIQGLQRRKKLSKFRNLLKNNKELTNIMTDGNPTENPQITDPDDPIARNRRSSRETTYIWSADQDSTENQLKTFLPEYIEYGMNVWAGVAKVNFKYVPYNKDTRGLHILVKFGTRQHDCRVPFDGPGGETSHVIERGRQKEIHFDDDEEWRIETWNNGMYQRTDEKRDFIEEVIHNIGKVFTFKNSDNPRSVMHKPLPEKESNAYYLIREDIQKVKKTKGHCLPPLVHAAFSDAYRGSGLTYMIIGPYTYQFRRDRTMYESAYVNATWPRPSPSWWINIGFRFIDEVFTHTDDNSYFFSGDEYQCMLRNDNNNPHQTLGPKKIGKGNDSFGEYIGWPGLKHHKYIDAALRNGTDTYIFQDEWVYLWDSKKNGGNDKYHKPKGAVAEGWPKKIEHVFGLKGRIDTAFTYYFDNYTYFFQGSHFRKWDHKRGKLKPKKPINDLFKHLCNVYVCRNGCPCLSWESSRSQASCE